MSLEGGGHGTIISGQDAQGDQNILLRLTYIINPGDSTNYEVNTQRLCVRPDSMSLEAGDTVQLAFNTDQNYVEIQSLASSGIGRVSDDGSILTVIESGSGDTGLEGEVEIHPDYGHPHEMAGKEEVSFSNLGGMAAFLR